MEKKRIKRERLFVGFALFFCWIWFSRLRVEGIQWKGGFLAHTQKQENPPKPREMKRRKKVGDVVRWGWVCI